MRHSYKKGFTLIELIIVIVIIGILAAIAMPIIKNMKAKAIATEALQGLSTIRQALRNFSISNGGYPNPLYFEILLVNDPRYNYAALGLDPNSFNGTYIGNLCYSYWPPYGTVECQMRSNSAYNNAPKASELKGLSDDGTDFMILSMNISTGEISQYNFSVSGYPPVE